MGVKAMRWDKLQHHLLTYNLDNVTPHKVCLIWSMIWTQTLHQRIVQVCCGDSGEIGEVAVVSLFFEPSSEGPTIMVNNPVLVCILVWHCTPDWSVIRPPVGMTKVLKEIVLNCAAKLDTFPCTDWPGWHKWIAITEVKCHEGREQQYCSTTNLKIL